MENLQKEFVPYELALKLKELGFDEPCLAIYDNITDENDKDDSDRFFYIRTEGWPKELFDKVTPVPLFSQCLRWFREKYQLHSTITSISQESWQWHITKPGESLGKMYQEDFYTYEEAEQDCLVKLIDIVENK
jgi:hypothetical protein